MTPRSAGAAPRIRVVLADDHPLYRAGLVAAIKVRPDLHLVGEANHGRMALDLIKDELPDVAVLDVVMPELTGPQVLNALRRDGLDTEVLFLSASVDSQMALEAVQGGARGYLSKRADRAEICDAIVAVARGEAVLSHEVQGSLVDAISRTNGGGQAHLSARE